MSLLQSKIQPGKMDCYLQRSRFSMVGEMDYRDKWPVASNLKAPGHAMLTTCTLTQLETGRTTELGDREQ